MKTYISIIIAIIALQSCVPHKKYVTLEDKNKDCEQSKLNLTSSNLQLSKEIESGLAINNQLVKENNRLRNDSIECYFSYNRYKKLYDDLNTLQSQIIDNNRVENSKLSAELNKREEQLKDKEKELLSKESNLMEIQRKNRELETSLNKTSLELVEREQKVKDLERILKSKDSATVALKESISKSLLGYKDNGLTVYSKNGKVYVSMEEKLLFKSASIVVDDKGKQALLELAKALKSKNDIDIMVEGHTDDVPMNSGQIKDNWDLSVLRATSIIRILTKDGGVDSKHVFASGRSEFYPLENAKTSEARAKNRRTEIILTPKLDELLKVLGN